MRDRLTTYLKILQLNFMLLIDNFVAERFSIYEAHYNIVGFNAPFETSGLMTMQSPANALLGEWLKVIEEGNDDFWNELNK